MKLDVQTKSGPVQGHVIDGHSKKKIAAFFGIPFAEPPVGKLRFLPPKPVEPWTDTFSATNKPKKCCQGTVPLPFPVPTIEMSEDCLKVNVWVPEDVPENAPVMVFIHGGAFVIGAPLDAFTDGINLAEQENVIVVTIAYRLGALGFLYLGTEEAPGNVGLLDQQLGLKWVKENISAFGGCSDNITIFGVSAGGASVGYHLLSEGSKGLFNRAIMLSGSPANPWAYRDQRTALKSSRNYAKELGFTGDIENNREVLDFMMGIDASKFENYKSKEKTGLLSPNLLGPTTDKTFLPISPREAIDRKLFPSNVDLMIGATSDEAVFFFTTTFPDLFAKGDDLGLTEEEYLDVIKLMSLRGLDDTQAKFIGDFYRSSSQSESPETLRDLAMGAAGDSLFASDIDHFAEAYHKAGNKVFKYIFDFTLEFPFFPKWGGAFHGCDQLITLASREVIPLPQPVVDFGQKIMRGWASFARHGVPKAEDATPESPNWPLYGTKERRCMFMKAGGYTVGTHCRERENEMWYHLLKILDLNQ